MLSVTEPSYDTEAVSSNLIPKIGHRLIGVHLAEALQCIARQIQNQNLTAVRWSGAADDGREKFDSHDERVSVIGGIASELGLNGIEVAHIRIPSLSAALVDSHCRSVGLLRLKLDQCNATATDSRVAIPPPSHEHWVEVSR